MAAEEHEVFSPFEVTAPHIIYALLGGFIVLFGMFSLVLREKLYIGEACWAFIFGIIVGPHGANIFNPRGWGDEKTVNTVTLELTRVVLAIGVFAIGVELPKAYMRRHWKSIFFLLVPIMTWGWFVSAALIYALIPGLNFLSSLAVAACLTPTDPILAAAVIGGKYADKHVPAHIRHLLAAESGCNDGAAFPFLFLALYLIVDHSTGAAIKDWFLILWLYQIVLGTFIGALVGFGFRHLMKFGEQHNLIDRHSYVAQYVSLAIFTIGITVLLGSDDLLATFACGTAFAWDGFFNRQTEESVFSSVIDLLFNIASFIYIGAWMPFNDFDDPFTTVQVWRLVVIAILVLLLRRLPIMIALYKWMPDIKTFREAVFSGHFGPIGVGAVFISTLAVEVLEEHAEGASHQTEVLTKALQPIVAFMVLCSITVHGLSIPSFSLGRRVHSVSRTWSRHTNAPDWTNQATLVQDGQEIVINRDDAMEKGEVPEADGIVDEKASGRRTQAEAEAGSSSAGSSSSPTRQSTEGEKMKEEPLPDGDEILSEWQEGPHTVIERRAGPGEEVQVEVIRNTDMSSGEALASQFFHGNHADVHKRLHDYLHHWRTKPLEVEQEAINAGEALKHEENVVKDKVKEEEHTVGEKLKKYILPPSSPTTGTNEDDEEDGWASEASESNFGSTSGTAKRLKSKNVGAVHSRRGGSTSSGRRRNSMRRGLVGQAHHLLHSPSASSPTSPSSAVESPSDDARGRSTEHHASISSLRHLRIDHLRSSPRRESSPARSIRFADDSRPGSGANTPRMSTFGENSAVAGEDEAASPGSFDAKNKVTFELPTPTK